jgi:hypothetical protein
MKFVVYIFIFLICALTTEPIVSYLYINNQNVCCGNGCEREEIAKEQNNKTDDNCEEKNGNPFHTCCCSQGFIFKPTNHAIELAFTIKSTTILFIDNSTSQYFSDVWQPPKLV